MRDECHFELKQAVMAMGFCPRCNGAQPGEVIFLSDCSHALAGTVQPLPDLPSHARE